MYLESVRQLSGAKREQWIRFLAQSGLKPEADVTQTVLLWEDDQLIGCGSRRGNLLKCIAVSPAHQGEGLTGTLLTQLKQEAFREGFDHLFLYTKPRNRLLFEPLFFYPVAKTPNVLLMESRKQGIRSFLESLDRPHQGGEVGAIVMNADPFTLGHQYLVETAAKECDWLYIFVLSEDRGSFSARDRMQMVRLGTAHLPNVTVNPTGPYLISAATFPAYFLKDRATADREYGSLDLAVFGKWFVPYFGITHRFAGTEPKCQVTAGYNESMVKLLPEYGVAFHEIPRREVQGEVISASTVRSLRAEGKTEALRSWVPESTWRFILESNLGGKL